MDQYTLIVCVLTFLATASAVLAIWHTFVDVAKASAERMDSSRALEMGEEIQGDQIERFIKPGQLLTLRLIFGAVPAVVVLGVVMLAGFRHPAALAIPPVLFLAVGSTLPLMYYRGKVKRRQLEFEQAILDFTVGIGNALRAGMALPQAIERVGEQMNGAMKEELAIVLREYRLGIDLVQALHRLAARMPCEDMRLLVSAIKLTTDSGGSLSSVLVEMSEMIRGRREFLDKVKALTAEGRFEAIAMSCAPIVAFVFLHMIQAELMRPLYTTGIGWATLGAVAMLEIAGYFVIRKIVSVEV